TTLSRVLGRAVPIYVHYPHPGSSGGPAADTGPLYDRLNVLQHDGISQAIALLQGYGAKRIAYVSGVARSRANESREAMLRAVMAERGLPPPIICPGDFSYDTA